MSVEVCRDIARVNWTWLRDELIADDFHNGRTVSQLRRSFDNSHIAIFAFDGNRCIGTARALSDGVCNAYVVDVWTHSEYRRQGIGTAMMAELVADLRGQHIYLFTDDQVDFYKRIGFRERPVGLEKVSGEWLENAPDQDDSDGSAD